MHKVLKCHIVPKQSWVENFFMKTIHKPLDSIKKYKYRDACLMPV